MASSKLARGRVAFGAAALVAALVSAGAPSATMAAPPPPPVTSVDLSTYVRVGRFDLPEPTRTTPPAGSLLAQEASAVAYNWDTDTLFIAADGGTSVVQVTKTGQLVDSMTLAAGGSPQGTEFYDTEGITYVGGGQFVMTEERDRRVVRFTYVAGTTLTRAAAQTVTLGTNVGNIGLEGLSYDPLTSGFVVVKETLPQGIFQTNVDFGALTATNVATASVESTNLFSPSLAGLLDIADVFALSNLPSLSGQPQFGNLLVLSQESGKIVNISRTGVISSSLAFVADPGNPLDVASHQHEGLTMDRDGILYVVNENGGGDFDHPQLWVYAPSLVPNTPPTAVTLTNQVNTIVENSSTATRVKVADVVVSDDGLGTNNVTLTGTDAAFFEYLSNALYIRAGTILDFETKAAYAVTVNVDDTTLGATPDATAAFTLTVTDVAVEAPPVPTILISEVAPWSSGNSPASLGVDWFELTNTGAVAVTITGWKMDDSSPSFASAVALNGITSIAPGESVIFLETNDLAGKAAAFRTLWFGASPPAGLQIGNYTGSGVGLSTGGDAVNIYNAAGVVQASVSFGVSPGPTTFPTFNNAAGLNNTAISQLSVVGVNGALAAVNDANEIGSPGTVGRVFVSEVAAWSSGNSPVGADWFEVTNTSAFAVNVSNWRMDDSSGSFVASVPMSGIASIAPGESVIFIEGATAPTFASFRTVWFGDNQPANLQIGAYTGGGVGLSTGGDAVNLYNAAGVLQASVSFGASPGPTTFPTFDNAAARNNTSISQLSVVGVNGAVTAVNDVNEIGSPGRIANRPPVANAGADQTVEATGPGGALVTLNGTGSTDPDANALACDWKVGGSTIATGVSPGATFALGVRLATLTVLDGFGGSSTDTVQITVRDTTGPAIHGTPSAIVAQATSPAGAVVTFTPPTASDLVDGPVSVNLSRTSGSIFPVGPTTVTCTATDVRGNASQTSFLVTVLVPVDTDRDGLTDPVETLLGTLTNNRDTDGDGIEDGVEVAIGSNPLSAASPGAPSDLDKDGIPDLLDTAPNNADSDGDGVKDGWEMARNGNLTGPIGMGDADGSGGPPTTADVTALKRIVLGQQGVPVNVANFDLDLDRNGVIDNRDATLLLYRTLNRVPYLPYP